MKGEEMSEAYLGAATDPRPTLLTEQQADVLRRRAAATFIPQVLDARRDPPSSAREIATLRKLIKQAGNEVLTVRLDLTPAMFEAMLFFAFKRNRKISKSWVAKMQVIMREGRYRSEVIPFHFDWEGDLRNGQHRASAALAEGVTLAGHEVKFGMDPEDFEAFDVGNKRNASQFLELDGVRQSGPMAAVARFAYRTDPRHPGAALDEQGVHLLGMRLNDEVMVSAFVVAAKLRNRRGVILSSAAWAYRLIALEAPLHSHRVDEFCDRVLVGDGLPPGSAILKLHAKLYRNRPGAGRKHAQLLTQAQHCAWLIETFKSWAMGWPSVDLSWSEQNRLPGFDDMVPAAPRRRRGQRPIMRNPPMARLVI
jgi:hypothetical protein